MKKQLRNFLVAMLLIPCLVMLAACGSGSKKPKDPIGDDEPGGGGGSGWFASVAATIRGAKLSPEFDDIMPGVLVGGMADASPSSSQSWLSGAQFVNVNVKGGASAPEGPVTTTHSTGDSDIEFVSSTRNDDIKWVMRSFESMVGSEEGSMIWLYVEMFLNSGLTEKGVWQEVGDAFIEWYIGAMSHMFGMDDYIPSPEDIRRMTDELIRMTAGGVFFKYEEVGNDKTFYGDIPMAGAKIMLSLKGDGAVEMFMSNDQACTPNNLCDPEYCDGDESWSGYNYIYYHGNELISADYWRDTYKGQTSESIGYWEFKKVGDVSTGKTVNMWTREDGSNSIEARHIDGDNTSITMLSFYEWDSNNGYNYSSYKITTLVDGIVMTFGENDLGEITNLYFDAKAFENLGDITFSRTVHTQSYYRHDDECGVHRATWDDACDSGCDDVQTQIQHQNRCGYYTGTRDDLCDDDTCYEVSWASHPSDCGWYWDYLNGYKCTMECPIMWTWINHTYDYEEYENSCGYYTRSWDELCTTPTQCTETRSWINHKYTSTWNDQEQEWEYDRCGVYTARWDDFCNRNPKCADKAENWYTYTWSNVNLISIDGMEEVPDFYNNFRIENRYEYIKVVEDDGRTYWNWTPSQTEVYAYFEIGRWGWGYHDSVIAEITELGLEDYFAGFNGLKLKEGFVEAFNSHNDGSIKEFFDNKFNIDGFDTVLDGEKVVVENFDLFKSVIMNYVKAHDFTRL